LNAAIRELTAQLNDRPMRGWGTTRRALFEQIDRPALLPLPPAPYEYAEWKRCRVNLDYHVEIGKHFYSVPFQLLRQEVDARITAKTVEIFHRGKLVAAHLRSLRRHRPSTVPEHMPSSHRRYRDWTHERIQREAAAIGDDCPDRADPALPPASGAGVPLLHRHPRSAEAIRRRAAGRRLRPGARAWHPLVQLGRRDPDEPAGGEADGE
jgi:Mu transposase-like protein